MSALTLFLLIGDKEADAEIYSVAADKDQAKLIYKEAAKMVAASPALRKRIKDRKSYAKLFSRKDSSFYAALSSDVDTKDGINAHAVIVDELHTQATRNLLRALRYAGRARHQPLFIWITTAGRDVTRPWYAELEDARKIQAGTVIDIEMLAVVYEIGEDADYEDESLWAKANPAMGELFTLESMRAEFSEAKRKGEQTLLEFRQLMLNQIVRVGKGWLSPQFWVKGDVLEIPPPEDGNVFAGLDLAETRDINAFVLGWWVDGGRKYVTKEYFWCPADSALINDRNNRDKYLGWRDAGLLKMTLGFTADYGVIYDDIVKIKEEHNVHSIAYDPWNATHLVNRFIELWGEEFMQRFRQGMSHYNAPTKELERLLWNSSLVHRPNQMMEWMVANCVAKRDPQGNIMPDKEKSSEKIDGVPAAIMSLGLAMNYRPDQHPNTKRGFFD